MHLYGLNDALFNKKIDGKDRDLAKYDDFINLHRDASLEQAEFLFDWLIGVKSSPMQTKWREPSFGIEKENRKKYR